MTSESLYWLLLCLVSGFTQCALMGCALYIGRALGYQSAIFEQLHQSREVNDLPHPPVPLSPHLPHSP